MHAFDQVSAYGAERRVCEAGSGWILGEQLGRDVLALRAKLESLGGAAGPVLLAVSDRYHLLVALEALVDLGRRAILLPNFKQRSLSDVAQQAQVAAIVSDQGDVPVALPCLSLPEALDASGVSGVGAPRVSIPADTVMLSVYTSGTSGAQQRIDKTAGQLLGEARLLGNTFSLGQDSVVASTVPSHHVYGLLFSLLVPAMVGARFVRQTPFHPEALRRVLPQFAVTDLVTVPAHARAITEAPPAGFPKVARVFSSGAVMATKLGAQLSEICAAEVIDVLGSTETGGIAWRRAATDQPFTPFEGVSLSVSEDEHLLLDSPFLAPSEAKPQRLGDRVKLVDGGFVHLGRSDGVVKIGGKRVSVQELEARAKALPNIRDAAVLVEESKGLRGTETWLVVETEDPHWTANTLRTELGRHLDSLLVPRRYRTVKQLPRTETGKLPRAAIYELFEPRGELLATFTVPESWVFFQGHFEHDPILPGVVQLSHVLLPAVKKRWPELGPLRRISRVKFRQPIRPGATLKISAQRKPAQGLIDFELSLGDGVAAQGVLGFS